MKLLSKRTIKGCDARGDGDSPYLTRWTLLECRWFAIYLHKFHRSDADEHHDHPWAFCSLILWRGYLEETACTKCGGTGWEVFYTSPPERDTCPACDGINRIRTKRAWPGMVLFRRAKHRHRVQLIRGWRAASAYPGGGCYVPLPAWTLIIRGPYVREWGFFTKQGWQHWKHYFVQNGCGKWSRHHDEKDDPFAEDRR